MVACRVTGGVASRMARRVAGVVAGVVTGLDVHGQGRVDRSPDDVVGGDRQIGLVAVGVAAVIVRGAVVGVLGVVPPVPGVVAAAALAFLPRVDQLRVVLLRRLDVRVPGLLLDRRHGEVHQRLELLLGELTVVGQRVVEQLLVTVEAARVRRVPQSDAQRRLRDDLEKSLGDHRGQHPADDPLERNSQVEGGLEVRELLADLARLAEAGEDQLRRLPLQVVPADLIEPVVCRDHRAVLAGGDDEAGSEQERPAEREEPDAGGLLVGQREPLCREVELASHVVAVAGSLPVEDDS